MNVVCDNLFNLLLFQDMYLMYVLYNLVLGYLWMVTYVLNFRQSLGASPDPTSEITYHINLKPPFLEILCMGLIVYSI